MRERRADDGEGTCGSILRSAIEMPTVARLIMIQPTNVSPITDFKRNTPDFVKRLKKSGLPEVLTIDGRGELVVQDATAYQRLLDIVERAEAVAGIRRGLADLESGRTMSLDEFEARLRKRMKAVSKA